MARAKAKLSSSERPSDDELDLIYSEALADTPWEFADHKIPVVRSVPTVFYDFNWRLGVGGLPVDRIHVITGPTSAGKTAFVMGLVRSFLDEKLLAGYIDAERSLEKDFVTSLLGGSLHKRKNFWCPKRILTYQDAMISADTFFQKALDLKTKHGGWYTGSLLVVDSITKLAPEKEAESILKEISEKDARENADELSKGHQGRDRARLNQSWLDKLTGQAAECGVAVVLITQERIKGKDFRGRDIVDLKGGSGIKYDSSLVIRITKPGGKSGLVYRNSSQTGNHVGTRHNIHVTKSKVGALEDGTETLCTFYLANGSGAVPKGFDVYRDLLETATNNGVVKKKSNVYWEFDGKQLGKGEEAALEMLVQDQGLFKAIENALMDREASTRAFRRRMEGSANSETGEIDFNVPDVPESDSDLQDEE